MGQDRPVKMLEIDAVCDRFETAWQQHGWPRFEDHLGDVSRDWHTELLSELLRIDVAYRRNLGQSPEGADYERWLPGHEKTIHRAIAAASTDQINAASTDGDLHSASISTLPHQAVENDLPPAILPGSIFGDYKLLGRLGRGGMGVVYRARQQKLNRDVALKMIGTGSYAAPEEVARFWAEAESAARLQHPHIVGIHEIGEISGQHFFSMDLVEGVSLKEFINDQPLAPQDAVRYLKQAAEAISYAHSCGVLHRDLKPSNMLVDEHDQLKITDFGLAKRVDAGDDLTVDSQVLGTPSYMPPEQAVGDTKNVDETADVYSLGATLYELLTGRPPFRANTTHETLNQVIAQDPARPRSLNGSVPQDLENVCLKCLEKVQTRRYTKASELVDELDRYLNGEPVKARPISYSASVWRWCCRNPVVSTLALTCVIAVAVGVPALISYGLAATKNRVMQANQTEMTELIQKLSEDPSLTRLGLGDLRRRMIESTEPYLNKIISGSLDNEQARIAKVKAYGLLAFMESEIGNEWMAMKQQQSGVALAKELCDDYPNNTQHLLFLSEQYHGLGYHSCYIDPPHAIACTKEALKILEPLEDELQSDGKYWFRRAVGNHNLAVMLLQQHELAACLEHFREAKQEMGFVKDENDIVEPLVHMSLDQIDLEKNRRFMDANFAAALEACGRLEEAEQLLNDVLSEPSVSANDYLNLFVRGSALRTLGQIQENVGRSKEARQSYQESFAIHERLVSEYPLDRKSWIKSCFFLLWQTEHYVKLGNYDEANRIFGLAEERFAQIGDDLEDDFTQANEIEEHLEQTRFLLAAKFASLDEAEAAFQELDVSTEYGTYQTSRIAEFHYVMAAAYSRARQTDQELYLLLESEKRWLQAIESTDMAIPDFELGLAKARRQLGVCYLERDKPQKAKTRLQEALEQLESLCETNPRVVAYRKEREKTRQALSQADSK